MTVTLNNTVIQDKIEEAVKNNPSGMGNAIQVMIADDTSKTAKVDDDLVKNYTQLAKKNWRRDYIPSGKI